MARQLLQDEAFPVRETDLDNLEIALDPETVYWLQPLTVERARAITKRHTRQVLNKRTHRREDDIDNIAVNNDMLDATIVRWEGVKNGGPDNAPCDLAHKLKLPLDIQVALIERAQVGQTAEDKEDSFRKPARVRSVSGG